MQINPYLSFNGQCETAFKFYEQCLEGKGLSFHKYGGSPMASQVPADWHDKVMHATLLVGDAAIMGADAPPSHFTPPQGFSVSIGLDSPADAERIFAAMSKGGQIRMPIQQTFWAARFGMFIDQFGIPWMINCEQPEG
jgi:PhnB protein